MGDKGENWGRVGDGGELLFLPFRSSVYPFAATLDLFS